MSISSDIQVTTRDGTKLGTSVWRPSRGRTPVLLVRTPYDRAVLAAEGLEWARRGYAFVGQDVRGRYGSQGMWRPYTHEVEDGLDTLDWLCSQPWCSGAVILKGASYQAYAARTLAATQHPSIRGIISAVPAVSQHDVVYSPDGALHLSAAAWWCRTHGTGRTSSSSLDGTRLSDLFVSLASLPVHDLWRALDVPAEIWQHYLTAGPKETSQSGSSVPVLNVGGWFDPFVTHTLAAYDAAQPGSAVVVGPWSHDLQPRQRIGHCQVDLTPHDFGDHENRWIDSVLGTRPPFSPRVKLGVLGSARWYEGETLPATRMETWWLDGSGGLVTAPPDSDRSAAFVYDPSHPVPSVLGPVDYRPLEARPDILSWSTRSLERPIPVVGTPVVRLLAASTAPATDFVVHLTEVRPDGSSVHLTHGHTTRTMGDDASEVEVRLAPIAVVVPRGHGLRVLVTSSCFPYYRRALNTDDDWLAGTRFERATQTVHSGPAFPSVLELPTLDEVLQPPAHKQPVHEGEAA